MFITLEGGEGVGKSTLMKGISDWLAAQNIEHVVTREPGGSPLADRIRGLFLNPDTDETMHKETELCLVSGARSQHVRQTIRPALEQGKWVLCDRFADSSRVYQAMLGKLDKDIVESIITMTTGGLTPELTLLLDCDVEVAMHRVSKRDSDGNRYDNASLPLHKEIRQSFLKLSETFSDRVVIIDAGKSNTDALAQSIDAINNRLDND